MHSCSKLQKPAQEQTQKEPHKLRKHNHPEWLREKDDQFMEMKRQEHEKRLKVSKEKLEKQREMMIRQHEVRILALQASVESKRKVCKFCPNVLEGNSGDLVCAK